MIWIYTPALLEGVFDLQAYSSAQKRLLLYLQSNKSSPSCFRTCACVTDRCRQESTGIAHNHPALVANHIIIQNGM